MNREKISRMREKMFRASVGEFSLAGSDFRQALVLLLSSAYHLVKGMKIFLSALALSLVFFFIAPVLAHADLIDEGFEGSFPPAGWWTNHITTGAIQSTTQKKTGAYSVQFNNGLDELRTPVLGAPGQLSFWLYSTGVSLFYVKYSNSVSGPWTDLTGSPITANLGSTFVQQIFDLTGYEDIYIKFNRGGSLTYYLDDLVVTESAALGEYNFRINAGTVTFNNGADLNVTGSIVIKTGGVLAEGTGSGTEIRLTKRWTNYIPGGFTYGDSIVELYSVNCSTFYGNSGFYNLKCIEPQKQLTLTSASTQTVNATLTLTGTSGNEIKLRSSSSGSRWFIDNVGNTESVSYVDVKDGNASSSDITATDSIDSGNNDNSEASPFWTFPDAVPPAAISNLTALAGTTNDTVKLQWTAPGDDGAGGGNCSGYLVRYATYPITTATFSDVNVSTYTPDPVWTPVSAGSEEGSAGNRVITGLKGNVTYYFAIKAYDDATPANYGYWSATPNLWNAFFVPPNPWNVVISQFGSSYPGAGDYIEVYNPSNIAVDLSAASIQRGTGDLGTITKINLAGTIPAYGFYLVGDAGTPVAPDVVAALTIANDNWVALVNNQVNITTHTAPNVIDFVGLGANPNFEGSGTITNPGTGYCERLSQSGDTIALLQEGNARALFGNSYDTDDNANNFIRTTNGDHTLSEPQSSASSHEISSAPLITNFTPTTGPAGTQITIYGKYFGAYRVKNSSTSHVYFYNNLEVTTYGIWSDTYVVVEVPVGVSGTQPIWMCTQDDFTRHTGTSSINFEGPSDVTDPAPVTNLTAALSNIWTGLVTLSWVAPKEDGASGGAVSSYDIRYSTFNDLTPANWWTVATQLSGEPTPSSPGTTDYMSVIGLANGSTYWFRIKSDDEIPNTSDLDTGTTAQILVSHIVIGEIQIGGGSATDEFIELYNPTTAQYTINGNIYFHRINSAGTDVRISVTYLNNSIPSSGYFLLVSSNATANVYDGNVLADAYYNPTTQNLTSDNAVYITTGTSTNSEISVAIDLVGMGTQPSPGFETQTSTSPSDNNSIERYAAGRQSPLPGQAGEYLGNAFDTNNNTNDFIERTTSDPQNSTKAEPVVLGVSITEATYDFTSVELGVSQSTMNVTGYTVTNTGNLSERYKIRATTATADTVWDIADTPALNRFTLRTGFNASQPAVADFGNEDKLTESDQTSSATIFAVGQTGINVAREAVRTLWTLLEMPLASDTTAQQKITITITAEEQP